MRVGRRLPLVVCRLLVALRRFAWAPPPPGGFAGAAPPSFA